MPGNAETFPFKLIAENTISCMYMSLLRRPSFSVEMLSPRGSNMPETDRVHNNQC